MYYKVRKDKGEPHIPFRSESQRKYLWMKEPAIAKRWSKEYGTPKDLPEHVKKTDKTAAYKRAAERHG